MPGVLSCSAQPWGKRPTTDNPHSWRSSAGRSDPALRQLARVKEPAACTFRPRAANRTARLADGAGLSAERVERLLAVDRSARGLEEHIGLEEDQGGTFGDLLADPVAEEAYERVDRRLGNRAPA